MSSRMSRVLKCKMRPPSGRKRFCYVPGPPLVLCGVITYGIMAHVSRTKRVYIECDSPGDT